MRRLFRISLIILVGVGLLWFAARQYLTSQAVTKQVVAHLTELYGGPVSVRQADIGLKHSSIHGAQLFEEGAAPDQAPWLTAETVSADVSLWSLMKGTASPSEVQLTGAKVTLRFDSDGRLLTRLPGRRPSAEGSPLDRMKSLPHLHAEQSEVTLHKEGHPDIILKNVKLDASPKEGRFVLHGTGENTEWGQLILDGMLGPKNELALTLKTAGQIQITQTMLDALPLVPASIWRDVQAEGITAATLTVRREADATTHYRVELEPRDTRVTVPVAALKGTNASGKLVIEDGVVRLRDVKGQAYEGTLQIDADLDFRGAVTQLDFSRLDAHGLDVRQLPESWGLPEQLEGRLDASGDVHLTLEQGKVSTTGAARGEIRDARIAGQSVDGPIELQLAPEGPPLQADPKEDRVFAEPVLRQRDSLTQAQSASDGTHHTSPERQRRD
ncbi:MAG TPA: AsmA-like C-terminal region-containing protein, partial [Gemmataceae bacterium]|nr:AsmA-like C-terminal region-containing protein [Gemmataceae bacterium]